MKKNTIILWIFFLISILSFGQNQVLFESNWQFEKFIINGNEISNSSNYTHGVSFSSLGDEVLLKAGYCSSMFGLVGSLNEDTFSYQLSYDYGQDCDFDDNEWLMYNTILSFYFFENNPFNYSVTNIGNSFKLEITNSQNDVVIYNNVNLSTDEFNRESDLIIFPNPVESVLNFKSTKNFNKINIYTIEGKLIQNIDISYVSHIDLSILESGVYFVEFCYENIKVRKKIFKK